MHPRFLKPLGTDNNEKHFFNAIRFKRQQDLAQRKLDYTWKGNGHKLYPSSIKSLTMCPLRFIQEDVHKPPSFTPQVVYSLEIGKAVHSMFQTEALSIPGLLHQEPDYSQYALVHPGLVAEMKKKRKAIHPEVPVVDPLSGISGRADLILTLWNGPVVFDIKTTSVEDLKVSEDKSEILDSDRWLEKCKSLPSEEHKLQVGIYCYLINKFQLYPQKVRKAGLGYVNLLLKPGDPAAEYEVYFDFTEELEQKIGTLIEHLGKHRQAYFDGQESTCEYPLCRAHNLRKTLKEAQ